MDGIVDFATSSVLTTDIVYFSFIIIYFTCIFFSSSFIFKFSVSV